MLNSTKLLLLTVLFTFLLSGVIDGIYDEEDDLFGVSLAPQSLVLAMLGYAWCNAHQRARGIKLSNIYAVLVALVAFIGVPVYFYRSMPVKQASWSTLKAIGYFIVTGVIYGISYTTSVYFNS